jgi:hypothetical protein
MKAWVTVTVEDSESNSQPGFDSDFYYSKLDFIMAPYYGEQ